MLAVAAAHGKTSAQVALRWIAQQDIVVVTSSDKATHDEGDLGIFDFELSGDEMARLTAVHARLGATTTPGLTSALNVKR